MLKQRLLYGALMILAIVAIVVLDGALSNRALARVAAADAVEPERNRLVACGLPVTLLVVMLTVLATYEMAGLCRTAGYRPVTHWAATVGAGLAFLPWLERMQREFAPVNPVMAFVAVQMPIALWWIAGGLLGACLAALLRRTTERALTNMALTCFLILYLGLLGSFVVRIRLMELGAGGAALVVYYILTVKSSDIGAFFTGRTFGRHKLIPWLSPGKTIEGAFGAVLFSAGVAILGIVLWKQLPALGPAPLSLMQALFFGVVMAVGGHLGDLTESAFKRDVGTKDSGQVVPAFGGLLDILDSPLFTAPIAWWLLNIWAPAR